MDLTFLFVVLVVILATAMYFTVRNKTAKLLLLFLVMAAILWSIFGFKSPKAVVTSVTVPGSCEAASVVAAPAPIASCSCDPSAVPFTDMGELNSGIETVIVGPAIYEWWLGGELEGVQRVEAGYTVTIHGAMGHWWALPSQASLDCAWKLHVGNYAAKPQHAGKTIAQLIISPPVKLIK